MDKFQSGIFTAGVWALDFVRAYNERPFLCKILARLIFGRYAYTEFIGLIEATKQSGLDPFFCYGLEEVSYQKIINRKLRWWRL